MRVKTGLPKAADIPDAAMLLVVENCDNPRSCGAMNIDIRAAMPGRHPKIIRAKLSKLVRRGLLAGCDCGCRGDWRLTARGRELMHTTLGDVIR